MWSGVSCCLAHPILPATTNQTAINQLNPLHSTLHPQFPSQAGEIKVIWDFKFQLGGLSPVIFHTSKLEVTSPALIQTRFLSILTSLVSCHPLCICLGTFSLTSGLCRLSETAAKFSWLVLGEKNKRRIKHCRASEDEGGDVYSPVRAVGVVSACRDGGSVWW